MKKIEISDKAYYFLESLVRETQGTHARELDDIITLACIADHDLKQYKKKGAELAEKQGKKKTKKKTSETEGEPVLSEALDILMKNVDDPNLTGKS